MKTLDPAVVMRAGGKVDWLKDKGPEHVVSEYFIYCWLGRNAFSKQRQLFQRIQACSHELGSVAIICRNYSTKRTKIQQFHDTYLSGPVMIPIDEWNAHRQLLEDAVVDIESFFWFANRLLTHIALTLNYLFRKITLKVRGATGVRSHSTLVSSRLFELLPRDLQKVATELKINVSDFRNADIEHDMRYWRSRSVVFSSQKVGSEPEIAIKFPPSPDTRPNKPLRELWIDLHEYLTAVAKFVGTEIK